MICFDGCDAIFKQLRSSESTEKKVCESETTEEVIFNSTQTRDSELVTTMSSLMQTIMDSLKPTVTLSDTDYRIGIMSRTMK